jgi:hypothetical protein
MLLTEVILRLRAECPIFQGRVSGTQSFVAATSVDSDIGVPCCFVVPMSDTAAMREGSVTAQLVTERFATVVCGDNSQNARFGRGYSADTVLRQARDQLSNALMNWAPLSMQFVADVQYARSQHLFMNNARIWHQYEWTCAYYMGGGVAADTALSQAIAKIISGYFPMMDAATVTKVMSNTAETQISINPKDPDTFDVLYEVLYGTNPDWIKYTPTVPGTGSTVDAGDAIFQGHYKVDP